MRGLIPESFIEELLARTDIVEVVQRRIELKKAGNEFHARCPFHDENTPSFTVSPQKQFYHCFGCGAHGSAIGFLMNYEGLEFRDAIEDLAGMAGLQVPKTDAIETKPRTGLYEIMQRSAEFFQNQLKDHPPAIEYLKQRGLSGEICRDFSVGYAPASWDALQTHLGGGEEGEGLMARGGLLSQGSNNSYDKFRDRIMFPIHDRRGRVIAFGGRAIADDGPKYLNSPETELFHKGRELYGLYQARQRHGRLDSIIVVEGYMDVVALAQYGIRNCVATLGTATTTDQAANLLRTADTVVYCFDGDKAGKKAAWRALESTLPKLAEGKQARFLFLPDGEDPDSLVREQGADAFNVLLEAAEPLSDFLFRHLSEAVDLHSIDGRAKLVQTAMPLLEKLPDGVFKNMMTEKLEALAQHRLRQSGPGVPVARAPVAKERKPAGGAQQRTPIRLALAHLVQNPELVLRVGEVSEFKQNDVPGMDIFLELVDFCEKRPNMTTAQLMELMHGHPAHSHLVKLAVWSLPGDEQMQGLEFQDAITKLRLEQVEKALSAFPRIVDLDSEQRKQFLALQGRAKALKDRLQGRKQDSLGDEPDGTVAGFRTLDYI